MKSVVGKGPTFYVALDVLEKPTEKKLPVIEPSIPEVPINKNFDLISAPQAEMGIDLAKTRDVDLILVDINLPGMDGVAAMKTLRRIEKTRKLPILTISANAMEKDIKSCLSAGFNDYIVKPINIPKFLEKIDKLLT